jgi:hypothetical protein
VRALDAAGVLVDNIEVRQPSLDDVFFSLTGGHIEEGEPVVEDVEVGAVSSNGSASGSVNGSAHDELEEVRA